MGTSKPKKVLIPLPDSDFDPTEGTQCQTTPLIIISNCMLASYGCGRLQCYFRN